MLLPQAKAALLLQPAVKKYVLVDRRQRDGGGHGTLGVRQRRGTVARAGLAAASLPQPIGRLVRACNRSALHWLRRRCYWDSCLGALVLCEAYMWRRSVSLCVAPLRRSLASVRRFWGASGPARILHTRCLVVAGLGFGRRGSSSGGGSCLVGDCLPASPLRGCKPLCPGICFLPCTFSYQRNNISI